MISLIFNLLSVILFAASFFMVFYTGDYSPINLALLAVIFAGMSRVGKWEK